MAAVAAASGSEQDVAAPEPTPAPAPACALTKLDPQLLMDALRVNSELLEHLLHLKDKEEEYPQATLDPQLLMAALCGDSKRLKRLLQVKEQGANAVRNEAGDLRLQVVDSEFDGDGDDAPPVEPLDADGVTIEGDSLLHVVAACGDTQEYLDCAEMIYNKAKGLLVACNSKGDTPLHCAAGAGNANMISHLISLAGRPGSETSVQALVRMPNESGETALQQAVRAASKASRDGETLVRMPNKHSGETALQQAVRVADKACIDRLMAVDSDLACIPPKEEGSSPLYLAISLGEVEIAQYLYAKTKSKGKLSYSGPGGTNVLHAAVSRGDEKALSTILGWFRTTADDKGHADPHLQSQLTTSQGDKENGSTPLQLAPGIYGCSRKKRDDAAAARTTAEEGHHRRRLLSQLTSQKDKENGSTPLHLAASLGGFPSPEFIMYKTHPYFWGWKGSIAIARLLLDANESTAYQPDKRGLYPIHVAAGAADGRIRAVLLLLKRCPECATLRDAKGRTFLHVAVEESRRGVVKYVCRQSISRRHKSTADAEIARKLSSILNAQDFNGDTALHRAVHTRDWEVFFCLARNQMVRLDVKNKKGLTPMDVAWREMPLKFYYAWDSRIHIRRYLIKIGAPYGKNRGDLFQQRCILPKQEEDKMSENLTAAAQVLGLFAVLMTTATFAAAFTLPGGYRSAGDAADAGGVAGTPVLAWPRRSYAFDAFNLSNALAFLCSLFSTSLLLYAGVPSGTLTQRFATLNLAYTLMWQAGRCLLAAFALGLYVVLFPVARTIAVAVVVLVIVPARIFVKGSEGLSSHFVIGRRRRTESPLDFLLHWIIYALDHFWSYIIIFGLPAIHKWAKLP